MDRLGQSWVNIKTKQYEYGVRLVGNPEFEEFTVSDWYESPLYIEGEPAPEFTGEVADVWKYGQEIEDPEEMLNALRLIVDFRIEYGMTTYTEPEGVIYVDRSAWNETCSQEAKDMLEYLAWWIEFESSDDTIENLYPEIDYIENWVESQNPNAEEWTDGEWPEE